MACLHRVLYGAITALDAFAPLPQWGRSRNTSRMQVVTSLYSRLAGMPGASRRLVRSATPTSQIHEMHTLHSPDESHAGVVDRSLDTPPTPPREARRSWTRQPPRIAPTPPRPNPPLRRRSPHGVTRNVRISGASSATVHCRGAHRMSPLRDSGRPRDRVLSRVWND